MTPRVYGAATVAFTKGKRAAMQCRVALPSVLSFSGGLIVALTFASRVSARAQKRRRVNNMITAKVTRIDLGSSRLANDSFVILYLSPKTFNFHWELKILLALSKLRYASFIVANAYLLFECIKFTNIN